MKMSDEHAGQAVGEHAAHEQHHPQANYWIIFAILCVLTAVSALADKVGNKGLVLTFVVLAVATAKALFVMGYFMHLKFEGRWKFVLLAPTIILALAIPAALMPDIGSHYYDYDVPQTREPDESAETGHAGAAPGGHEPAPPAH